MAVIGRERRRPQTARVTRTLALWRWLVPGLRVKRYALVLAFGVALIMVGFLQFARLGPGRDYFTRVVLTVSDLVPFSLRPLWLGGLVLAAGGGALVWLAVVGLTRSIVRAVGSSPDDALDQLFTRRTLTRGPRIVAIGGGTGLSNLLSGLKIYTANITAVVAVTDDGGSSGRLRRSLGMPAPGDLTDCYAALSDTPILAKLLLHRFDRGEELAGHTFGNLLLATLSEERGDFAEAIGAVNDILKVRGRVVPATSAAATLVAELESGERLAGESGLHDRPGGPPGSRIRRMHLEPADPPAMPEAVVAIGEAEMIVLGPGSLFTSVMPPLLVPRLAAAIRAAPGKLVYVVNIMTEPGETDGFSAADHARAVAEHLGRQPDVVVLNSVAVDAATLERYRGEGAELVATDGAPPPGQRLHEAPLTSRGGGQHDPHALALSLIRLLVRNRLN